MINAHLDIRSWHGSPLGRNTFPCDVFCNLSFDWNFSRSLMVLFPVFFRRNDSSSTRLSQSMAMLKLYMIVKAYHKRAMNLMDGTAGTALSDEETGKNPIFKIAESSSCQTLYDYSPCRSIVDSDVDMKRYLWKQKNLIFIKNKRSPVLTSIERTQIFKLITFYQNF